MKTWPSDESPYNYRLAGEGSNLQPTDSKSVVLPIELPANEGTLTIFGDS